MTASPVTMRIPFVSLFVDPDNFIVNSEIGFVTSNTANAAKKIEELMNDLEMWQRISSNCVKFARENFSIGDAVDKLEQCAIYLGVGPARVKK